MNQYQRQHSNYYETAHADEIADNEFFTEDAITTISQRSTAIAQAAAPQFQNEDMDYEKCPNCARSFFSGRLQMHLKVCKPGRPQKPLKKKERTQQDIQMESNTQDSNRTPNDEYQDTIEQERQTAFSSRTLIAQEQEQTHTQTQIQAPFENEFQEPDAGNNFQRVECELCGRKFMPDRIDKHINACQKSSKKRPVFNSTQHRLPDDQQAKQIVLKTIHQIKKEEEQQQTKQQPQNIPRNAQTLARLPTGSKKNQPEAVSPAAGGGAPQKKGKMPKWKQQHESFILAMKRNKKVKDGDDGIATIEEEDPMTADYVQCQYCQRKFNALVAERHIPKCKEIINRPKPPAATHKAPLQNQFRISAPEKESPFKNNAKPPLRKSETSGCTEDDETNVTADHNRLSQRSSYTNLSVKRSSLAVDRLKSGTVSEGFSDGVPIERVGTGRHAAARHLTPKTGYSPRQVGNATQTQHFLQKRSHSQKPRVLPQIKGRGNSEQNFYLTKNTDKSHVSHQSENATQHCSTNTQEEQDSPKGIPTTKAFSQMDVYERASSYSNVACPHCLRKFAPKSAERHIPICKNILNRAKPPLTEQVGRKTTTVRIGYTMLNNENSPAGKPKMSTLQRPIPLPPGTKKNLLETVGSLRCQRCEFQFGNNHKYCGNCGLKRASE